MKTKITALLLVFLAVFSRAIFGAESLDEIRKKAAAGDAVASYKLGLMYSQGYFVLKDSAEATLGSWVEIVNLDEGIACRAAHARNYHGVSAGR